jgi:UDP-N-acetylmuramate--alanine ligase
LFGDREGGLIDQRARLLAEACCALERERCPLKELPRRFLVVDADLQRCALFEGETIEAEYAVSTAAAGMGTAEGSLRTPPGWHRLREKIGASFPLGTRFVAREPTGDRWNGEEVDEDLILTRILRLEGLEDGVNRGPGRDTFDRLVYLHGTNHERHLGLPRSHGCIRLANQAIADLHDRMCEGDIVVIVGGAERTFPDPAGPARFHYAGIGGSGMSALAQFQRMTGGSASGSDRSFDRGERADERSRLQGLGIELHSQDGSGVRGAAALVVSTAVEPSVPDVAIAQALGLPIVHRSELLAHFVAKYRSIAVSGTSGKSTVVGMIYEILDATGRAPSVITGGELVSLQARGLAYTPSVAVVLNLQKDHKEPEEVAKMFHTLRERTREAFVVGADENLAAFTRGATVFGTSDTAHVRASDVTLGAASSSFALDGQPFRLEVPGAHNVTNALAAIAACRALGVSVAEMAEPLREFRGIARRFQSLGTFRGAEVIDDFAHNPAKIEAALATAHLRARRVLAVYQPHGYRPTRFLWKDFVASFARALRSGDRLWFLEVFYAGGTAQKDFSSRDIIADLVAEGVDAEFAPSREDLVESVTSAAREGDLILIMGARDPSLTTLARSCLEALRARG